MDVDNRIFFGEFTWLDEHPVVDLPQPEQLETLQSPWRHLEEKKMYWTGHHQSCKSYIGDNCGFSFRQCQVQEAGNQDVKISSIGLPQGEHLPGEKGGRIAGCEPRQATQMPCTR